MVIHSFLSIQPSSLKRLCSAPTLGKTYSGKAQRTSPTLAGNTEVVDDQNKYQQNKFMRLVTD